ncbi:Na+/H+ antiporter NhaA [Pararoseomonas indoligenes]|uniref:Na(+)/H(+) antiporter NhaA n=1 Tax=Roseomonas indoligenes TaxID=2820811 RepID=A0A940S6P3_9PROT|nr:Na+/H+ antiporter NhaA [Pararoseomonas indoligenes]MBP0494234.1 Na+/H+ antiporter NhaA [Pararoseomonas indoligenes]
MAQAAHHDARPSALRRFLEGQSSAGLVLMAAAALALVIANTPLNPAYQAALHAPLGPLSVELWINDGLMAVFFLLVGLEIKRESLDGQLSTWPRRALPGIAAAGGMAVPALVFLALNPAGTTHGWAIPAATDIAFALGVISLLGSRVPASLRVFLAALAIIDDLGAVLIIALFYNTGLSWPDLAGAALVLALLFALNRLGVLNLLPYLLLGAVLWVLVLRSGIHATLAGVLLALAIPLRARPAAPDDEVASPLHRLEHALHIPVGFLIVPVFGLANAGVPFLGLPASAFAAPVTLGVGLGLLVGKAVGVFGAATLTIRLGLADLPPYASRTQLFGTALLCGIGFTMSLFITLLAFPGDPVLQAEAKIGILGGSLVSGLLGYALLRVAPNDWPGSPSR